MNQSKISVRYAKALFELAKEQNLLSSVKSDMSLFVKSCVTGGELQEFLASPVYTPSQKKKALRATFSGTSPLTIRFLELLADNKREVYLRDIARNFLDLVRAEQGVKTVTITSAVSLDTTALDLLLQQAVQIAGGEVELELKVDTQLLGGFVMRVGDQQIDASVATKLKRIRTALAEKH